MGTVVWAAVTHRVAARRSAQPRVRVTRTAYLVFVLLCRVCELRRAAVCRCGVALTNGNRDLTCGVAAERVCVRVRVCVCVRAWFTCAYVLVSAVCELSVALRCVAVTNGTVIRRAVTPRNGCSSVDAASLLSATVL